VQDAARRRRGHRLRRHQRTIELSDKGDPTSAIVGIYTYGPDNKLTDQVDYQPGTLEE
jgi:hypothetical protein